MRFNLSERYDHWPFEGTNYICDLKAEEISIGLEVRMMDWLEEHKISHAWNMEDRIVFKRQHDRTLFVLRFS